MSPVTMRERRRSQVEQRVGEVPPLPFIASAQAGADHKGDLVFGRPYVVGETSIRQLDKVRFPHSYFHR
jgi:hypothetical protein